jgi:hypothetical protein
MGVPVAGARHIRPWARASGSASDVRKRKRKRRGMRGHYPQAEADLHTRAYCIKWCGCVGGAERCDSVPRCLSGLSGRCFFRPESKIAIKKARQGQPRGALGWAGLVPAQGRPAAAEGNTASTARWHNSTMGGGHGDGGRGDDSSHPQDDRAETAETGQSNSGLEARGPGLTGCSWGPG